LENDRARLNPNAAGGGQNPGRDSPSEDSSGQAAPVGATLPGRSSQFPFDDRK
jgi:hypothetical protein